MARLEQQLVIKASLDNDDLRKEIQKLISKSIEDYTVNLCEKVKERILIKADEYERRSAVHMVLLDIFDVIIDIEEEVMSE